MFDMRYHIASLVAVFLALSLGILVGTSIVNKGVLVKQQQKLVESINESIKNVKQKNRVLSSQVDAYKDFENSVFTLWCNKKLKDKKIAVCVFDNDSDKQQEAKTVEWLKGAGATPVIVTITSKFFLLNKKDETALVSNLFPEVEQSRFSETVIAEMVKELAGQIPPRVINKLESADVLKIDDKKMVPFDGFVFIAGPDLKLNTNNIEVKIASTANNVRKTVVIEGSEIQPSGLEMFINERLSTVDNIDCGTGGISLVEILLDKKGNFGIKEDAERITPME